MISVPLHIYLVKRLKTMLTVLSVLVSLYAAGVLGSSAPGVHKKETNGGFEVQNNGAWNYDYGHKAGSCPTTCDTTTKCGPECWTEVPGGVCDGLSQTPINVVQAGVNSDLSYPTLTTTSKIFFNLRTFTKSIPYLLYQHNIIYAYLYTHTRIHSYA